MNISFNAFMLKRRGPFLIPFFRFSYCFAVLALLIFGNYGMKEELSSRFVAIEFFEFFGISQLSPDLYSFVYYALIASLFLSALGIMTRLSLLSSSVLFFLFIGDFLSIRYSPLFFDTPPTTHSHNMIFYLLFTMIFLPSVTKFSLMDFVKKRKKLEQSFLWEEVLIILVICSAYFGGGLTKLMDSGFSWMQGSSLQAYLTDRRILFDLNYPSFMVSNIFFLKGLSIFAFLFECVLVFGLLFKKARWWVLSLVVGFHLFNFYFLKVNFLRSHCILLLFFLGYFVEYYLNFKKRNFFTEVS